MMLLRNCLFCLVSVLTACGMSAKNGSSTVQEVDSPGGSISSLPNWPGIAPADVDTAALRTKLLGTWNWTSPGNCHLQVVVQDDQTKPGDLNISYSFSKCESGQIIQSTTYPRYGLVNYQIADSVGTSTLEFRKILADGFMDGWSLGQAKPVFHRVQISGAHNEQMTLSIGTWSAPNANTLTTDLTVYQLSKAAQ